MPDVGFALTMTGTGDTDGTPNALSYTSRCCFVQRLHSKHSMEFTFTAETPPPFITVRFRLTSRRGWDMPVETDATDAVGRVTATLPDGTYSPADTDTDRDPVHADDLIVGSGKITIKIKELAQAGTVVVLYGANFAKRPAVQNTAQNDLEITGNYMVGSNARYFPKRALTPVTIDITNAASRFPVMQL